MAGIPIGNRRTAAPLPMTREKPRRTFLHLRAAGAITTTLELKGPLRLLYPTGSSTARAHSLLLLRSHHLTHLAIDVIRKRLSEKFPGIKYRLFSIPRDLEPARALAASS